MAKTKKTTKVSIDRVCKTCAFHDPATGYCKRKNEPTPSLRYACDLFMTPDEWRAECEARILAYYESLTHVGIFHPKDFRHFTTKR